MKTIRIHSNWHGNITLDVLKSDKFACDAAKDFGFQTEDHNTFLRIPVITPTQARAFVAHCE